jgi:hypothetical protein
VLELVGEVDAAFRDHHALVLKAALDFEIPAARSFWPWIVGMPARW